MELRLRDSLLGLYATDGKHFGIAYRSANSASAA
jgi:hypothetical protein